MYKCTFLYLLSFLCLPFTGIAQSTNTGIVFFSGNWKSLLEEARKQNKLIFVDVYTDWCIPCKRMEKEVFTLAEVGKIYNDLFVNYQLNAERDEGIKRSGEYAVKSYPSYLFLDSNGTLVYRTGDYMKAEDFITAARSAQAKKEETGSLASLEASFKLGNRSPDFLKALLEKRTSLQMDNAEIINAYVSVLPPGQLYAPETMHFLSSHLGSTVSDALPVLLKGMKQLNATGQQQIADKIYSKLLYYALGTAIKERRLTDARKLMSAIGNIRASLSEKHQPSLDNLTLHYFHMAKDTAGLKKIGYQMAAKQVAIPVDTIRKRDSILFTQVMQPFWSGKLDSTKVTGFSEEKKLASTQYSAGIASTLYTIANAFNSTLAAQDKALNDALKWIRFATDLYKNDAILKLQSELENKVRNSNSS